MKPSLNLISYVSIYNWGPRLGATRKAGPPMAGQGGPWAPLGPIWVPIGPHLALLGPIWSPLVQIWTPLAQFGPNWAHILYYFILFRMISYYFALFCHLRKASGIRKEEMNNGIGRLHMYVYTYISMHINT